MLVERNKPIQQSFVYDADRNPNSQLPADAFVESSGRQSAYNVTVGMLPGCSTFAAYSLPKLPVEHVSKCVVDLEEGRGGHTRRAVVADSEVRADVAASVCQAIGAVLGRASDRGGRLPHDL